MTEKPKPEVQEAALFAQAGMILEAARAQAVRSVNTTMVHAYWLIGRSIVEVEQGGRGRAKYGEHVAKQLATNLQERFGRGFTTTVVKRMRLFYRAFPQGSCIPAELGGPSESATETLLP